MHSSYYCSSSNNNSKENYVFIMQLKYCVWSLWTNEIIYTQFPQFLEEHLF